MSVVKIEASPTYLMLADGSFITVAESVCNMDDCDDFVEYVIEGKEWIRHSCAKHVKEMLTTAIDDRAEGFTVIKLDRSAE